MDTICDRKDSSDTGTSTNSGSDESYVGIMDQEMKSSYCCKSPHLYLCWAASISALGGVLFGYDIGIISGALLQLRTDFCLSCIAQEAVVSSMLCGAILASLSGGFLVDYFGRRNTIIGNTVLFTLGATVLAAANTYAILITGRVIVGFAVALSVVAECVYISEISPPEKRGFLVSLNEMGIVVGFLLAYLVNLGFIQVNQGWRYMFGISIIPAVIQGIGMFFLPQSPRFLILKGKEMQAREVLSSIYDRSKVESELKNIMSAVQQEKSQSCLDLCSREDSMRFRLFIGMGLVFLQQFTGQPNVLYYAPTVFQLVGFDNNLSATLATVVLGATKAAACFVSLLLLDRVGRRKCLISGAVIMTISITTLGIVTLFIQQNANIKSPCSFSKSVKCATLAGNQTLNETANPDAKRSNPGERYIRSVDQHWSDDSLDQNLIFDKSYASTRIGLCYLSPYVGVDKLSTDILSNLHFDNSKNVVGKHRRDVTYINHTAINTTGEFPASSNSSSQNVSNLSKFIKWISLLSLVGFVAGYELGFGTATWLVLAEIYPSVIRGRAIAIATIFNWGINLLVSLTFLDMMNSFGVSGTFIPYGFVCALSGVFVYFFLPETMGKTLEQIGHDLSESSFTLGPTMCCIRKDQHNSPMHYSRINDNVDSEIDLFMDDKDEF